MKFKVKFKGGMWVMWVGVGLVFALLLAAWTVLFTLVGENPVEQVPLVREVAP